MDAVDLDPENDMDNPDTLLFARRLCDFDAGRLGADLDCNDDRGDDPAVAESLLSRIQFQAAAGETTYIFADSFTGQDGTATWQGEYTLTITRAAPPALDSAVASYNEA